MASRPLYRLERISTGGKVEAINNYHSKTEAERDAKAFRRYIKAAPLGNVWKYRVRRLTTAETTTSENPASIRAQVRRLPSGQIQLKIPIGRSENPHSVIAQLKRVFGNRVKAVEMTGGKNRNPGGKKYWQFPWSVVVDSGSVGMTEALSRGFNTEKQARAYIRQLKTRSLHLGRALQLLHNTGTNAPGGVKVVSSKSY